MKFRDSHLLRGQFSPLMRLDDPLELLLSTFTSGFRSKTGEKKLRAERNRERTTVIKLNRNGVYLAANRCLRTAGIPSPLGRNTYSPIEPLITFIELLCRPRPYSSIGPYHCQSISNATAVGLRQTSRRNQPIYRGTMGQHDSIVSRRLCINSPFRERFLDSSFSLPPVPLPNISRYASSWTCVCVYIYQFLIFNFIIPKVGSSISIVIRGNLVNGARYIGPICGEFVDRIRVVLGGKLSNRFITRGKSCLRSGSPMVNRIIVKLIGDSKEKDLFLLITSWQAERCGYATSE